MPTFDLERVLDTPFAGYQSDVVGAKHIPPIEIPDVASRLQRATSFREYYMDDQTAEDVSLNTVEFLASRLTHIAATGVDMTFGVDSGANTNLTFEPKLFTPWQTASKDSFVRFSEARTGSHSLGLLRSPVNAGIAIERTMAPDSTDPRDIQTLLILAEPVRLDARYPYNLIEEGQDARVFDMASYSVHHTPGGPMAAFFNLPRTGEIVDPGVRREIIGFTLDMLQDIVPTVPSA